MCLLHRDAASESESGGFMDDELVDLLSSSSCNQVMETCGVHDHTIIHGLNKLLGYC